MNRKEKREILKIEKKAKKERREQIVKKLTNTYFHIMAKCRNCGEEFESGTVEGWESEFDGYNRYYREVSDRKVMRDLGGLTSHRTCGGVADIIRLEKKINNE